jgi:hypothetical protein
MEPPGVSCVLHYLVCSLCHVMSCHFMIYCAPYPHPICRRATPCCLNYMFYSALPHAITIYCILSYRLYCRYKRTALLCAVCLTESPPSSCCSHHPTLIVPYRPQPCRLPSSISTYGLA